MNSTVLSSDPSSFCGLEFRYGVRYWCSQVLML